MGAACAAGQQRSWTRDRPSVAVEWGDLVFCGPLGVPRDVAKDRSDWRVLLAEAGVDDQRLYDARQTAGTLLMEAGPDIHKVKEALGHSQISVSSRYYLHPTGVLARDTAVRLGGAPFRRKSS